MVILRRIPLFVVVSLFFTVITLMALPTGSFAQVGISVTFGPPPLPVYEQPPCPAEGYIWTPGYWAYGDYGYYWVPGTWVLAPQPGFLWTPAWWGWGGDRFIFHEGYWGPRVGFYGGIVYGFGYFGHGYEGGRWDNGRFFYNRSVNNVNVTNIHNVYNTTIINNTTVNRVSYNGGQGGINVRPRPDEEAAEHERHVPPVAAQARHMETARGNPELRASVNQGKPPIAATPKPTDFKGRDVVPAKEAGGPYHPPANRGEGQPRTNDVPRPGNTEPQPGNNSSRPQSSVPRPPVPGHAKDIQPHERPAPVATGNAKQDQKYQQKQEKLYQKQEQEHQKLQQKQEQQHQQLAKKNADDARKQQTEQKHQQQTQQMEQKHAQQEQKMQSKQPKPKQ